MHKKNIKTKWNYSKLARHYDLRADYSEKLITRILKKINCKRNYPVADIGAGTGKLTKLLCKEKLIVSAVEPNKNMRFYGEKNTKKFHNLNWSSGTGETTFLKSNSIYCIFFGSSFNTVDYRKTFKEIKRVLIKGGYICCLWNHRNLANFHQRKIEMIIKKFIPNFHYGDRRFDYKRLLKEVKLFKNIQKINQKFVVKINKKDFIKAWRSHGTLRKNSKNLSQFKEIIRFIDKYVNSIKGKYIEVPYNNIAFVAKLK